MPTHRRRGSAAGADGFSFASPAREAAADAYDRWAERIKSKYNYFGRLEDVKYGAGAGAWTRGTTTSWCEDEFSPEIWQAGAGRRMARSAEGSPVRRQEAEAPATIARYRQEMLDLVKDVPENAYELSLIDMVETARTTKAIKVTEEEEEEEKHSSSSSSNKKKKKKGTRSMSRSASMETGGGLLLKMFVPRMPAALGGRRQSFSNPGARAKVSPTRARGVGEKGRVEGEWWSKEYGEMVSSLSSSNSNGSSSSSNSNSSGSSIKSRIIGSCYPFASHKGKQMGFEE